MSKPVVVQHSFGASNSGGPIGALDRVMSSDLANRYTFVRMHQDRAIGRPDVRLVRAWARKLRELRPDLVHVRGLGNEGFQGALAARIAGVPRVLVSIHGTARDLVGPGPRLRRALVVNGAERLTLGMATHIATVCESAARRDFLAPYQDRLIAPLLNGVELSDVDAAARAATRRDLSIDEAAFVMTCVGRLTLDKGHFVLADALRRVDPPADRPLILLVAGDGPARSAIEARYGACRHVDVRVLGMRRDVRRLLAASDLFVFPTLHENASNALLEAMACGLPCVATAVGGNVEILEGGGTLIPARDPAQLALAIARYVSDRGLCESHGKAGRQTIEAKYTIDHMVRRFDEAYQSILGGAV